KFNQQRDEHQSDRQSERDGQFSEARLLLSIQPAIFNRHSGRKSYCTGQLCLNLFDGRTEIDAFQPCSYRYSLAHSISSDFGLAFVVSNVGDLVQPEQCVLRWRANRNRSQRIKRFFDLLRHNYSNVDFAFLLNNDRRRVSGQRCSNRIRNVRRIDTKLCRALRVNLEGDRRTADSKTIKRIDYPWYFLYDLFDFRGFLVKRRRVLAEKFYFHRLRLTG